ncbi:MAG: aminoglycoside phosphotransferase family protein [Micromonosporaceae bacterium]|nr:aminoglycoside phosphotransferase family protein [Micromonosporaceae bacterium]
MKPPEQLAAAAHTETDLFTAALRDLGRQLGVATAGAQPLRMHSSGFYLLPQEQIVVRLAEATDEHRVRWHTALQVTSWLTTRGFPTIEPAHPTVVNLDQMVVSLWRYLPEAASSADAPASALGVLLRQLHQLPDPPFVVPEARPLARLARVIVLDTARRVPVLSAADRAYLAERMVAAEAAYQELDFPLGRGLIHNDAHGGNLMANQRSPLGYVLGDWDGACWGPREIDLVPRGAPGNRFGATEDQRREFSRAYGYDLAQWQGWPVLRELRELHSMAAYLRTAPYKPAAQAQLRLRLDSLMHDDRTKRWTVIW